MGLDDLTTEVEPEPEPAVVRDRAGTPETLEELPRALGIDPWAAVADLQLGARCRHVDGHVDRFAGAVLERVRQEVGEDLVESKAIPPAGARRGRVQPELASHACSHWIIHSGLI